MSVADPNIRPDPSQPSHSRWITLLAGILLAPVVVLCALGSLFLILDPVPGKELIRAGAGTVMLLLSAWLGGVVFRLITGRHRREGGLVSPRALRLIAAVFLVLPIGGLFSGYFVEKPIIAIARTIMFLLIFFALRRLAAFRELKESDGIISNNN